MKKYTASTLDPLYFRRTELAQRLLFSLKDGITHALTLFAPRRMGKTQFLLNDVRPLAEEMGFHVFYFSFMDQSSGNISALFAESLMQFLDSITHGKNKLLDKLKELKQIDVLGVGIELNQAQAEHRTITINNILQAIAEKSEKPVLMLLDEVQELARENKQNGLVRSLRTGLDANQSKIKVIFTGSSTNGLRAMFNDNKAPFFHFAHALDFPVLTKDFTDFLADIYHDRTGKEIDKTAFYHIFERFHFTPLYLRSIAQDMIINPDLTLEQATNYRFSQITEQGETADKWQKLSLLEQELLKLLVQGETALYTKESRERLEEILGIETISASTIQGKIKKLERNELITRQANGNLKINNPYFETWIAENKL
ncbi:selenocysteine synthase [Canicola haemoglobinophilus]|uniref:Selenocysteine synthase n=1 Tax=Canicola haemoglobinophilus TaxID=733 RepID=A0A1V4AY48_9PAST|nr:ATP-binding protein [Canicola haemoglobinophilus]OOR94931.1 selenocysteine synthase [Canicola haemoglobinophilus]STO60904.1 selenocysteine synthase [Canicola haemoglobinophilus]